MELGPCLRKIATAAAIGLSATACTMDNESEPLGPPLTAEERCALNERVFADEPVPRFSNPTLIDPVHLRREQDVNFYVFERALRDGLFGGPYETDWVGANSFQCDVDQTCRDLVRGVAWHGAIADDGGGPRVVPVPEIFDRLGGIINSAEKAAALAWFHDYSVGNPIQYEDGWEFSALHICAPTGCERTIFQGKVLVSPDGTVSEPERFVQVDWRFGCAVGRRPAGLVADPCLEETVGAFFAGVAALEESAVTAFDVMIDELTTLKAPSALLAAAEAARRDEVRHTKLMTELAERYGTHPKPPTIGPTAARSPFEITLENAVEGCIRETYGALVAEYQSHTAEDPDVRTVMREIAEDERRHAELSWALAGWLEPQLTAEERAQIGGAKADAIEALSSNPVRLSTNAHRITGIPDARVHGTMVQALRQQVWEA
ncbi:MAG: ferritin-like domain-containing protein [Myxococcota bacterium]